MKLPPFAERLAAAQEALQKKGVTDVSEAERAVLVIESQLLLLPDPAEPESRRSISITPVLTTEDPALLGRLKTLEEQARLLLKDVMAAN